MTETLIDPAAVTGLLGPAVVTGPPAPPSQDIIRDALQESRQRWRHLVSLAADLAFETDAKGRFVFVIPDTALGWPAGALIGQPSELLVGDDGTGSMFNPFRPATEIRRQRVWLRCFDGSLAVLAITATPLHDAAGRISGARGVGIDMTDSDEQTARIAGRSRRGEVIGHILSRVGQENSADAMMDAALWALVHALGAEGSAVIGTISSDSGVELLHECGPGAASVLEAAGRMMGGAGSEPASVVNLDGRLVMVVRCHTRFGVRAGLVVWRNANARSWDQEDMALASSTVGIVRMILEYEEVQQKLVHQARVDPLTGLLNRRAFIDDVRRDLTRLDRVGEAGTVMFLGIDGFKAVNDRLGHDVADQVLVQLGQMLLALVRPFDLIARLSGDEFAVWLSGADHLTAAERADHLCKAVPGELRSVLPEAFPALGVSLGIATRRVGSRETIEDLTKRADMAMYEVKRSGRGHWRVALLDGD